MANIHTEIVNLESILTNCRENYTEDELETFEEDLARDKYLEALWDEFGDIPMNPETECLEDAFIPVYQFGGGVMKVFPAGTHREDIWHWFEKQFCISVAEDLMY